MALNFPTPSQVGDTYTAPNGNKYVWDGTSWIASTELLLSNLITDVNHRTVTDTEKSTWNNKQSTLVSGTNIKTINNNSLLGNENIAIQEYTDANALSLFNAGGLAPVYACRAWVNFNGTGTVAINASGNVSGITDRGTGRYTVNLTIAMSDTHGAVLGTCNGDGSEIGRIVSAVWTSTSTINVSVSAGSNTAYDQSDIYIGVIR